MKIGMSDGVYEINNDLANRIFEYSKKFTTDVIDHCEANNMELRELLYHMIACSCHFNHLITKVTDDMGEEEIIKLLNAVKVEDYKEVK